MTDETEQYTDGTDRKQAFEEMEQRRKERNQQVREREECRHCGDEVPERDYKTKFMAAGGVLEGPFCPDGCYWGWLNS